MNDKVTGKSLPDMYGVVIHANVLSMILSDNFIKKKSPLFTYFLASLIVFFLSYWQIGLRQQKKHIAHWKLILLQLLSIILAMYFFYMIFSKLRIRVELLPIIIAIVLCVEGFSAFYKLVQRLQSGFSQPKKRTKKTVHK